MKIYIAFSSNPDDNGGCLVLNNNNEGVSYIERDGNAISAIKNALQAQIHSKIPELESAEVRKTADVYIAVMLLRPLSEKGVIECANIYLQVIRELFSHVTVRGR